MNDLIERLKKATGPDRELDALIAIAADATPSEAFRPCAAVDVGTFGVGGYGYWTAPAYTASIDATLTLLPDLDHHWKAGYSKHVPHNAEVRDLMHPYKGVFVGEHDHSRAIALCIAILKARALRDTTTDGINKLLAELRAEKKARASIAPGERQT